MAKVLVIGAGMAGLAAARRLRDDGAEVVVLDKGRAVGGRMATRRVGPATFDHGAQHISVRTESFNAVMGGLVSSDVAHVWLQTPSRTHPERGVEDRYAGTRGMRRIPEALAKGLDVQTGVTVNRLDIEDGAIHASSDGIRVASADAAVVTPPVPQMVQLLSASGIRPAALEDLAGIEYDATLAVMATLDSEPAIPDGHIAPSRGAAAWIADNQHKRVSEAPALTIHSSSGFASEHLEADAREWTQLLLDAARPHHEGSVLDTVAHRWRFSQPRSTRDDGAALLDTAVPIVLAGEVFAGARVEGAFTSGQAAADVLVERLD